MDMRIGRVITKSAQYGEVLVFLQLSCIYRLLVIPCMTTVRFV